MIAPSRRLNPIPPISPEHAAAMVVRGLVDKPAQDRHPGGHAGRRRQVLHPEAVASRTAPALSGLSGFGGRPRVETLPSRQPARRPERPHAHAAQVVSARCGLCRDRSSGRCDWCPACTGETALSLASDRRRRRGDCRSRVRRRRHRRRRRDGAGVPVRPVTTPIWSASRRPRETSPSNRFARTTSACLQLCARSPACRCRGAPSTPLSTPLRTAEDTHGPEGLGYAQLPPTDRQLTAHDAAEAWVRAAHALPRRAGGLATGPLTNLALALRIEPALPPCCGGW